MHYSIVKKYVPQIAVPNNQQCSFDIFAHGDVLFSTLSMVHGNFVFMRCKT